MKILFVGKKNDYNAVLASQYLKQIFPATDIVFGTRGEPFPESLMNWNGDYVFSYLSPWIIKKQILNNAKIAAINWHPGPPEYPGIGCTNFAIYNEERTFGMTCHHMAQKVDTGSIIEVRRFDVLENDTVFSITQKCYALILNSFYDIIGQISNNEVLPVSEEAWQRKPYTRKELDQLSEVDPEMEVTEIDKRIKATTYDRPWAFVNIKGRKFYYKDHGFDNFYET